MSEKQKSFVKGAAILAAAGIIVKIIGAVFRIPLANLIGPEGLGYYQFAYPIYAALLVVSTAGLPTAISKMVSERIAKDDYAGAHYTFQVAWRVLLVLGVATSLIMFALAGPISSLQQSPPAIYSLLTISPALFFVSMISAYRGYFQGLQYMTPTAVSQLLEQVGKLCIGLSAAKILYDTTGRPELGAMGAILGVTISEVVSLAYMMIVYRRRKGEIISHIAVLDPKGASKNFKPILKQIAIIAIPVTLGACVNPIVQSLDSFIVSRTLQEIGYSQQLATSTFGLLTGYVNPLINMPAVLSLALAMSLVPAISESKAKNDSAGVSSKSSFGFKLALLVGLPASLAFIILAQPIIQLLYSSLSADKALIAANLLQLSAFGVMFLTMIQTMTGILQGFGKQLVPVISLAIGAVAKVIVSILLIRIPSINIYGAAIGTIVCYAIAAVLDIIFAVRYTKFKLSPLNHIIKPVMASLVMGAGVYLAYRLVGPHSNTLGVLAAIVVGLIVYLLMLIFTKGLTQEELAMVPGGGKLEKVMKKLKVWK